MNDCVSPSLRIPIRQPATTTDGKINAATIAERYRFTTGRLSRMLRPARDAQNRKNAQPANVGNMGPPPVMIACCHGSSGGPDVPPE